MAFDAATNSKNEAIKKILIQSFDLIPIVTSIIFLFENRPLSRQNWWRHGRLAILGPYDQKSSIPVPRHRRNGKQRCQMHSELNSVCIRHLCFRGLLLRRAKTAIGVLEDMLLFPAILILLVPIVVPVRHRKGIRRCLSHSKLKLLWLGHLRFHFRWSFGTTIGTRSIQQWNFSLRFLYTSCTKSGTCTSSERNSKVPKP